MLVELRSIDSIRPYPQNPRKNAAAVAAVAGSIHAYGFRVPLILDREGVVIAGHTRLEAAKQLGMTHVPVHVAHELTPEQAKALRISDNKLHELSSWDLELLPVELAELKDLGVDLEMLGFSADELTEIMAPPGNPGLCDPDDVPEPPDAAETQPGDLWILGEHRLYCGDSSSAADLDRLLDGAVIHLANLDPPYNVNVEPRSNNARAAGSRALPALARSKAHLQGFDDARQGRPKPTTTKLRAKDRVLANDFMSDADFDAVLLKWFGSVARALVPGGCFYVWGGFANWANYCRALKASGLYFAQGITWVKDHPVLGRKDYMNDCEHAWYGWKEGAGHKFYGPNNARNVWHVKKVAPQNMCHLTEKPVELAARAITFSSKPGENVLDLFGGSGSTLIACEQQGRRAYLMELDALYCDQIKMRYEAFSGKKAVLVRGDSVAERKAPTTVEAGKAEAAA